MVESNIGSFTMYNTETHIFNPPDSSKTYDWIDEEFKITNWNTWMRAFSYWLRDKFDFTISSGSGSSLGLCGDVYQYSSPPEDYVITGQDNDWNNNNEYGKYGTYPIDNIIAVQNRCDSPFKPVKIGENYYYCDSDELEWNGQWRNNIYDDINNRFDIILSNNNFNSLGIRIKYPITTTGINKRGFPFSHSDSWRGAGLYNCYYLNPGIVPTINETNLATLSKCEFNTSYYDIPEYTSRAGFVTLITLREKYIYTNQYIDNSENTRYSYINLSPDFSNKIITWTPNFTDYLSNNMLNRLFSQTVYYCNTIQYCKSKDNTTLNITVINPTTSEKCLEFCFYKNLDNSSGLIIAEDGNQTRNESYTWLSINGMDYGYYGLRPVESRAEEAYGNYGNIIVSSNINQDFTPYRVKPIKYSKDIRDTSVSLIDETGLWRLEKFCALPSSGTFCKDLFLVTHGGTKELFTNEDKYIMGNLSGKRTKFFVYPFNSQYLGERNTTDSVTFFAIPVEQEE